MTELAEKWPEDPLGLPDLERARAPFELLPIEQLLERAGSSHWISARAFVRELLTKHNGDNHTKVPLRELELHPEAVAEMLTIREQLIAPIASRRQRMYSGYDLEGTLAWGLADLEALSATHWSYAPGLSWRLVRGLVPSIGSAYAFVYIERAGRRRVIACRRHELMSCVDPERFAATLVYEAAGRGVPVLSAPHAWQRAPYETLEAAGASDTARAIARSCRAGRAGVLADGKGALRLSSEMGRLSERVGGVMAESIWAHPVKELVPLSLGDAVTQVRACVSETIALRARLQRGGGAS